MFSSTLVKFKLKKNIFVVVVDKIKMHDWSIQFQTNCEDGGKHDGRLEIITWTGLENEEKLGFGGVTLDEADLLQSIFIKDFKGDEEAFYKEWPQAFRWTCCGSAGNLEFGCDHHGTGSTPCSCDFCISGHELPLDMVSILC